MNKIIFKVITEEEKEFPKNNHETWNIKIDAFVDQELLYKDYPVDLIELIRSKESEGKFFIFTCSCGIPECGGIYEAVKVKYLDKTVTWEIPKKTKIEFCAFEYINEINKVINDFIEKYELLESFNVEVQIIPSLFDDSLINKLKKYIKIKSDENIKKHLYNFLNENYEVKKFKEWIEENRNIENIIGMKFYNHFLNLDYDKFTLVKDLRKYLWDEIPENILVEVKQFNKNKDNRKEYFYHPFHEN